MRKLYWAWPAHLKEGLTLFCTHKLIRPDAKMVRVRVEVVKPKKRKRR